MIAHSYFFDMLGFIDVAVHVIVVAIITLVVLIVALLVAAADRAIAAASRAEVLVFEALIGLDRESAYVFCAFVTDRTRNVGIAWVLSVVLGPLGAYAYLGDWGKCLLALVTLNGLGAWWMESWFSIPQVVVIERRKIIADALAQLPFIFEGHANRAGARVSVRA